MGHLSLTCKRQRKKSGLVNLKNGIKEDFLNLHFGDEPINVIEGVGGQKGTKDLPEEHDHADECNVMSKEV